MKEETELNENSEFDRTLHFIACSDTRRRLLVSLLDGEKTLHDLYGELGISEPSAIHSLRELQGGNYVRADQKRCTLTFIGRAVALKILDLATMAGVLKEHETFWVQHDTSGIPDHLLGMTLLLRDSTLLSSAPAELLDVYLQGVAFFADAKSFRFVSTAAMLEAARFLNKFAAELQPLQLVLTRDLLDALIEDAGLARVAKVLGERCQLYEIKHDPKLILSLSDSVMTLMLSSLHGAIDIRNVLVARSKDGISWGTILFKHFVESANEVSLAEFA